MTITEQLKTKTEALRMVQTYIDELKKLGINDLDEVHKFINAQINGYKQLVSDINNKLK